MVAKKPSSSSQKSRIKDLLRHADFDAKTVTYMHRRLGVPEALIGRAVDEWLDQLDMRAASDLIETLMDIAGIDEDEESDQ